MRIVWVSLDAAFADDWEKLKVLPNIGRLIANGASTKRMETVFPALTYPAHVTMMTGLYPKMHGIGHNQPYDREKPFGVDESTVAASVKHDVCLDDMRPWHWDAADVKGETIFESFDRHGKTCAAILWPVTGKNCHIKYLFPEILALPGESQTLKMLKYGNPFYILGTEIAYGKQRISAKEPYLSDYATLLTVKLLEKKNPPDLIAVHLVDLDAMRHHHGTYGKEADEALTRLDRRVGDIMAVLDKRHMWDDTVLCLTSDHGQADVDRVISLDEAFAKSGFHCHAQSFGMGAAIHFGNEWVNELDAVTRFLNDNKDLLHIKHVYDRAALDTLNASDEYMLCVEAQEGTVYADCLEGAKREKATHGFSPSHPAGQCLMIVCGGNVEKSDALPVSNMTQIKPYLLNKVGIDS